MGEITNIEILLDETVKDNPFFQTKASIEINSIELFKYAIMMDEVPAHVMESDFDYLQSQIPYLEGMLSRKIKYSSNAIFNISNDDRWKKIVSEAIGVGVGLKYAVELLGTNPNKLKKIPPSVDGKYLDYSTIVDSKEYEIETKGTVSPYHAKQKKDILEKKNNKTHKTVHLRFGTIMKIKTGDDDSKSQCVVVDDPPTGNEIKNDDVYKTQLMSYGMLLSYILDSKYYNKYIKPLKQRKTRRIRINAKKFFGRYEFEGRSFLGECFDYRLVKDNLSLLSSEKRNKFQELTEKVGKVKFFIGIDEKVIDSINRRDKEFLDQYSCKEAYIDIRNVTKFLDKDGILIVKSRNGRDEQLERIFPEKEVENRLRLYSNYREGISHRCGAPCRSKEIKGKPCEIWTFRSHCHFHR
jgi:hypothetical protein